MPFGAARSIAGHISVARRPARLGRRIAAVPARMALLREALNSQPVHWRFRIDA